MRIACPSCHAVYDVPDSALAAGADAVRCARCGTEWAPVALAARGESPGAEPAPEPLAERVVRADSRLIGKRVPREAPPLDPLAMGLAPRPRAGRAALTGWVLSIIILVTIATAAVSERARVMAAWPPSERLFAVMGLR